MENISRKPKQQQPIGIYIVIMYFFKFVDLKTFVRNRSRQRFPLGLECSNIIYPYCRIQKCIKNTKSNSREVIFHLDHDTNAVRGEKRFLMTVIIKPLCRHHDQTTPLSQYLGFRRKAFRNFCHFVWIAGVERLADFTTVISS